VPGGLLRRLCANSGLQPEQLKLLSANHGIKVGLARRLRQETMMELKWIAEALASGSWKYLSNLLSRENHPCRQRELGL
jgi:hypothetical protein